MRDVLAARDARARRQREMREKYGAPLISFTMNIAGPVKRTARIERAFFEGCARIEASLAAHRARAFQRAERISDAGCEAIWAVDAPADALKAWMRAIEEADALGRIFDIDVLDADGRRLSRDAERSCLICGGPVRACARARRHSAAEVFARAEAIIDAYFDGLRAARIGLCAERALLFEALTTPKPGLVDCENRGAHADMDIFDFAASAAALRGWFEDCARAGMRLRSEGAEAAFEALRAPGVRAEREMLRASGGANTHKGALFSLGLICCAAGMLPEGAAGDEILSRAGALARGALEELRAMPPEAARSGGERQFVESGRAGARGEAAAGFPSVREIALPVLRAAIASGRDLNGAGLCALAALMARVEDSNLLRRGGEGALRRVQRAAAEALEAGARPAEMAALDAELVAENLSPGGSADLLAAAYLMLFLEREGAEKAAM